MNKIIAFIPARGGSKGVPGKNIKNLGGKPLIVHSIEYAQQSQYINEIIVSTDCKEIQEISMKSGAKIINRPYELADDLSTTESAIEHFINQTEYIPEIIILLQPTSPIRPKNSLDYAIKYFQNGGYDSLLSVCPTHRFFWKIKSNNIINPEYDFENRPRRQDLSRNKMNFIENGSLYIFTTQHFNKTGNRLGGKIGYVEWPESYSLEIDVPLDFILAESIYNEMI